MSCLAGSSRSPPGVFESGLFGSGFFAFSSGFFEPMNWHRWYIPITTMVPSAIPLSENVSLNFRARVADTDDQTRPRSASG